MQIVKSLIINYGLNTFSCPYNLNDFLYWFL